MQQLAHRALAPLRRSPEIFGNQLLVTGRVTRLLKLVRAWVAHLCEKSAKGSAYHESRRF